MTLNSRQRKVIIGGGAVGLLILLFPPWEASWLVFGDKRHRDGSTTRDAFLDRSGGIVRGCIFTGPLAFHLETFHVGESWIDNAGITNVPQRIDSKSIQARIRFDRLTLELVFVAGLTAFVVFLLKGRGPQAVAADEDEGKGR